MIVSRTALLVSLVLLVNVGVLAADVVLKRDGGKIVGTVILDESDAEQVTIKSRFGKHRIPRNDIEEIQYAAKTVEEYKDLAKKTPDTAQGHWDLAKWCLEHELRKEQQTHLRRVIELDPDHAEARKRLGYRRHDGQWMTRDEIMQAQGFVNHNGKWVLPQEKALAESSASDKKTVQEYFRQIRSWQRLLKSERKEKRDDAKAKLLALDNPLAVRPLLDLLGDRGDDEDRGVLVEVLDGIEGTEATKGLLLVALGDKTLKNRRAAVVVLAKRKSPGLLAEVTRVLRDNDNDKVCRAAAVLGEIGDSSIFVPLVEALVTRHKHVHEPTILEIAQRASGYTAATPKTQVLPDGTMIRPGTLAGQTTPIGKQSTVGPSPGPVVVVEVKQNPEVVAALEKLTGQDFGYDKERWIAWIREQDRSKGQKKAGS